MHPETLIAFNVLCLLYVYGGLLGVVPKTRRLIAQLRAHSTRKGTTA